MADIWTRPVDAAYLWATNAGARLEPTTARKETGWTAGDPLAPKQMNDVLGVLADWTALLGDVFPVSGIVSAQTYRVYDTAGPPVLAATIAVGATTPSLRITTGGGTFELREKGILGVRAMAGTDGIRLGYDSTDKLQIVHSLGAEVGRAYIVNAPVNDAAVTGLAVAGSPGHVELYGTSGGTRTAKFRSLLAFPVESTQTGGFPTLKTLAGTFLGSADDLSVKVLKIERSTGTETTLATIVASAASSSFGGGVATTPLTHDYAIEYEASITGAVSTNDGVRNVRLTVDWRSCNPSI